MLSCYSNHVIYIDDENQLKLHYACKLNNNRLNNEIRAWLTKPQKEDSQKHEMVAHIRRGDYISAGLPTLSLKNVFRHLKQCSFSSRSLTIVTDSPDLIQVEFQRLDKTCNVICGDELSDLRLMTLSKIFIASDSQFSLVSILLSTSMETVFIPSRWKNFKIVENLEDRQNIKQVIIT